MSRSMRGKTAVCMEVNFQEGGKYVGFRRAFATPDGHMGRTEP